MKRSRFSEEQIIGILKEHQAGMTPAELCRKRGISDAKSLNKIQDKIVPVMIAIEILPVVAFPPNDNIVEEKNRNSRTRRTTHPGMEYPGAQHQRCTE